MKKLLTFILFWSMLLTATAQPQTDPRSIQVAGIPIEGPLDSVRRLATLPNGDNLTMGRTTISVATSTVYGPNSC